MSPWGGWSSARRDSCLSAAICRPPARLRHACAIAGRSHRGTPFGNTPGHALVTGYDFLSDQAAEVTSAIDTFSNSTSSGTVELTTLINDDWQRDAIYETWLQGYYTTADEFITGYDVSGSSVPTQTVGKYQLASINAHFDHWQLIPATGTLTLPAQRIYSPTVSVFSYDYASYFTSQIGWSVGCHSGYNVIDEAVRANVGGRGTPTPLPGTAIPTENYDLYRADFPQVMMKQGSIWLGNTGYGYGTLDGVDYSERLSLYFTEELGRDVRVDVAGDLIYVGQEVGSALVDARQRYLRNATSLGPYDAKVLQVWTLYGLPFFTIEVEDPQPVPPELRFDAPADTLIPTDVPIGALGTVERIITFTLDLEEDAVERGETTIGSRLRIDGNVTVSDTFVVNGQGTAPELRTFASDQAGRPNLPQLAYDISARSAISDTQLIVRDVVFLEGTYGAPETFDPLISQIVTETFEPLIQTSLEPDFSAGVGVWFPDRFYGFTSVGEDPNRRDQLTVTPAQFRADAGGVSGTLRKYRQMTFKVLYTDPAAPDAASGLADVDAPGSKTLCLSRSPCGTVTRGAALSRLSATLASLVPSLPVVCSECKGFTLPPIARIARKCFGCRSRLPKTRSIRRAGWLMCRLCLAMCAGMLRRAIWLVMQPSSPRKACLWLQLRVITHLFICLSSNVNPDRPHHGL
ncbi:hypothetical protein HC891_12730 [Candidatus Gracilibacteria bacterium]|nr:hypothetical protein [Candidatus Gracilibacteria bacterium]